MIGSLSFAGVLDATFLIWRRALPSFLVLGLWAQLPLFLIELFVQRVSPQGAIAPLALSGIEIVLTFLVGVLFKGAAIATAQGFYDGGVVSAKTAYSRALKCYLPLLMANVGLIIGTAVFSVFVFIPGIWFYFTFILVTPVVLFEKARPMAALRRARELSQTAFFKVFGVILLIGLVTGLLQLILDAIALGIAGTPASFGIVQSILPTSPRIIVAFIVTTLTGTLAPIALTVLYHDLSAKKQA